ncbi:unnamed protein product [Moneuplotes crassus]|uniref:Uncharacterized protein n=1 Tax=Euplotes crassus TaxID=5936 RepID=A0AAD1Y332_EUPCR|nr:unnamed protein product [Moneuplotes crassus]
MHTKPKHSTTAVDQVLKTNFFRIDIKDGKKKQTVYKYNLLFDPEIPEDSNKIKMRVHRTIREDLQKNIGENMYIGNCLYALSQKEESFNLIGKFQEIEYRCTVKPVSILSENDPERYMLIKVLFNGLLKRLCLENIGRNYFCMDKAEKVFSHNASVIPGYASGLKCAQDGIIINIDVSHRVLRHDTVIDFMSKLRGHRDERTKEIIGRTVMTIYNKKTYRVTDVDYTSGPTSCFEDKQGNKIKYTDYYKEKYGKTIKNESQPLLIHENPKNKQKIILIPELCAMTGISDDMRKDFRFMKDLAKKTNVNATKRYKECAKLFTIIKENEKCKEQLKKWNLDLNNTGVDVKAKLYQSGSLVMGGENYIDPNSADIDRKIQARMLEQPKLQTWGIFYLEKDQRILSKFKENFQKSIKLFGYNCEPPAVFGVKSPRFEDWKNILAKNLNKRVKMIVLLLPGSKNNNPIYHDIKELLLNKYPVPSQVVLSSTIGKGKNLISICNKILIQMCAKIGGVPWTVSDIPCVQEGTMVCGLGVQEVKNKNMSGVLGFTSSKDKGCTKYFSTSKILDANAGRDNSENIANIVKDIMKTALEQYKKETGDYPKNVIVYREGANESRKELITMFEVTGVKQVFKSLDIDAKLAYLLVCKRVNVKLFRESRGGFENSHPGTVVNSGITEDEKEFFLISQKTLQGTATPTHYINCYDDTSITPAEIHELTYKLCFTYFNVSGSIRVPSLVQYATRFSDLMMNVSKPTKNRASFQKVTLHKHLEDNVSTLYYI